MNNKEIKNKSVALATIVLMLGNSSCVFADNNISKDETVYSILDENGNVNRNIVSAWINSSSSLGTIHDVSTLSNIKNVKGDEKPEIDGDKLTWDISEDDLYYQGETNKSLPISVNIKYELNGQEVSPKDIQGKTGKFKITLSLKNNESREVKIGNKNRTIYVPFITASEIILNRDNFKDIKTSTGALLDEGNNSAITFVSIPGFKESLDLDSQYSNYLNLKDEVVIEGNTTGFKTPTIMVAATSDVSKYLEDIDEDTSFNDLKSSLDKLQESGKTLVDGAKQVSDGASTLNTNYKKFNDGVKTLDSGIDTLNKGASQLLTKLPQLDNGAASLSSGLGTLSSSSKQLSNGAKQVNDGASSLYNGLGTLSSSSKQLSNGAKQVDDGASSLYSGLGTLSSSSKQLSDGAKQVNDGASSLYNGLGTLSSSSKQLSDGAKQVSNGASKLNDNYSTLDSGINSAYEGSKKLESGAKELENGTKELESKLSSGNEGLNNLIDSTKNIKSLASNLRSIADSLENTNSSTNSNIDVSDLAKKLEKMEMKT